MARDEQTPEPERDLRTREKQAVFVERLLAWFQENQRSFPWRGSRGAYELAVAEALLQKTAARNARSVYEQFIIEFPTPEALAAADPAVVVARLQPLGLPRRAELLQRLALAIVEEHGGQFPDTEEELRKLPGVGPYGAAAIACLAFGRSAPMLDINVMRIMERVFSLPSRPRSGPSKRLRSFVGEMVPPGNEREFNLALVDFGALVCQSRAPRCAECPLARICNYYATTTETQSEENA